MMKTLAVILFVLFLTGCKGQEKEQPKKEDQEKKEAIAKVPKRQWRVNKQYDDQGNLIKYDSMYSYSYSDMKGDSIMVNLDSIMDSFEGYFEQNFPFGIDDRFSYFPKSDSLFLDDFFKDDYFFDQWEKQPLDVEQMLKKMDSTRNAFLRKYHPGLLDSKKNKE